MSVKAFKGKVLYNYNICNYILTRVNNFNDLGVLVSDDLTWKKHIENCINRGNKRLGLVKRCLGFNCSTKTKLLSFVSLVRPLVEYNTVVWMPNNKKQLCKLESLQRRATKYILNNYSIGYKERLIQCNLLPLTLRRQYLDCVFIYNSINDLNVFKILNFVDFTGDSVHVTRQANAQDDLMFKPIRTRHELYGRYLTRRIVSLWNNIPYYIRSLELTDMYRNSTFKKETRHWLWKYFIDNFANDNVCTWVVACNCYQCRLI
jgi:hypothetical protein